MNWGLIVAICVAILALLVLRAITVVRSEMGRDAQRGATPGKGTSVIQSEYSSGMGGGAFSETHIPKDPQAYAQVFVPKSSKTDR